MTEQEQLFQTLRAGDAARLRELVGRDPALAQARDPAGLSALLLACYHRRRDLLEVLLAAAPDLDIFEATAVGRAKRVGQLLAAEPGLARAWSPDGFTSLHFAAFFGFPEIAELLLQGGADVNAVARNAMAVRPLHSAAAVGQRAVVQILLAHGGDPNVRQQGGWTPLQEAAHLGDAEMARMLLERGADPALANDEGKTALDLALAGGHAPVADLLRERG